MSKENMLTRLLQAVTEASGVTFEMLCGRERRLDICNARGVYYLIGRELGIHPTDIVRPLHRSRMVCITVASKYKGYLEVGDKEVRNLYQKVKDAFNATN